MVVELHPGKFYPKKKLDGVVGSKKMKVFGSWCATAREAGLKLALQLDEPAVLPEAPPRAPYGSKVTAQQIEENKYNRAQRLLDEAAQLLGVGSGDEDDAAEPAPIAAELPVVVAPCMEGAAPGAPTVAAIAYGQ